MLTVFLVTKVQNMDDHQSLAVAPFYLLGLYMLALLAANLPGKWLRRALAALVSVGVRYQLCGVQPADAYQAARRVVQRPVLHHR